MGLSAKESRPVAENALPRPTTGMGANPASRAEPDGAPAGLSSAPRSADLDPQADRDLADTALPTPDAPAGKQHDFASADPVTHARGARKEQAAPDPMATDAFDPDGPAADRPDPTSASLASAAPCRPRQDLAFTDLPSRELPPLAGARLARGVARALRGLGFVSVEEMVPVPGLRVDLMALGPKGEIWVIECKSGRADFRADRKWQGYLDWCDRFFWAVDGAFPTDLLPAETGLILADAYDAEILRMAPETPLAAARRKAVTQKFARAAAGRLQALRDPMG